MENLYSRQIGAIGKDAMAKIVNLKEKELNRQKVLEDKDMDDYIRYALDTESKKYEKIKKYE